jgi:hypothetical protein
VHRKPLGIAMQVKKRSIAPKKDWVFWLILKCVIETALGQHKLVQILVTSGALIAMAARSSPNASGLSKDIEPLWWEKITICYKRVESSKERGV